MTDAALPVTQRAVERITEEYLKTIGCEVEKQATQWTVTAPQGVETDIVDDELTVVCSTDPVEIENAEPLNPESSFFHSLIEEVAQKWLTGGIAIPASETEITLPPWIVNSDVSVQRANFVPYYDRTALTALFQVSVETVSEYQTELLRASTVDTRSGEVLPELTETVLRHIGSEQDTVSTEEPQIASSDAQELVANMQRNVLDEVQPQIDEIHEGASRSADAEVEEYRQLQQQRIGELEETRASLEARVNDLSRITEESNSQTDRTEALKQRRELRSQLDEIETKLDDLQRRRERGFPKKQGEIRNRHALEVVIKPVTLTEVAYERGEISLTMTDQTSSHTLTVGYGSGVGVTEDVECENCGASLSESNPIRLSGDGIRCSDC